MNSSKVPGYLHSQDTAVRQEQPQANFTFSQHLHSHNPQKVPQESINSNAESSKIEIQTPEKQEGEQQVQQTLVQSRRSDVETVQKPHSHKYSNSLTLSSPGKRQQPRFGDNNPSDDEERQSKGYEELTIKLQSALNKIAGAKKGIVKSSSQTSTIWRRAEECEQRRKKQIERKREQSQQARKKQVKLKPTINKNSEKISKEMGHEPIYNRYEKLMQVKKKREKETEEAKKLKKQQDEVHFMEQLNRHMRKPDSVRTYDQYFEEMVKWKETTKKHNRQKQEMQKSKELQGATFKPVLNSKSKKIVASQNRLPIDQRGLMKQRIKTEYTFKPNLSRKTGK